LLDVARLARRARRSPLEAAEAFRERFGYAPSPRALEDAGRVIQAAMECLRSPLTRGDELRRMGQIARRTDSGDALLFALVQWAGMIVADIETVGAFDVVLLEHSLGDLHAIDPRLRVVTFADLVSLVRGGAAGGWGLPRIASEIARAASIVDRKGNPPTEAIVRSAWKRATEGRTMTSKRLRWEHSPPTVAQKRRTTSHLRRT